MTLKARTELSVAALAISAVFAACLLVSARAAAMHAATNSVISPVVSAPANP